MRELLARIKAVLRRVPAAAQAAPGTPEEILRGPGALRVDVARREVQVGDTPLELTQLEFDLLHALLVHTGRVLTREQLLEQVWGYAYPGDARAVDSVVKRLRAKLRAAAAEADGIEAVRGVGYKLTREEQP
jgi:two-component system alkaline phosphatase synthesis response regulator PhoP